MTAGKYSVTATDEELATARQIGARLQEWFGVHGRDLPWRPWRDAYRVAITEALLQRTRAEVVARFVVPFFGIYPDPPALLAVETRVLEAELAGLGLQRRRAIGLKALARAVAEGVDLTVVASAPGVGQYMARAVAVSRLGAPVPMVDSNYVRVLQRAFPAPWKADYRYDRRLQAIASAVVEPPRDSRATNWAMLDLGSAVCRPRSPRCGECPIPSLCLTGRPTL